MTHGYDDGYAAMCSVAQRCAETEREDLNEAETRLRFIDDILFQCLDWDKHTQCTVETRPAGKESAIDYLLRIPPSVAVVEAKKAGVCFTIPVNDRKARVRKLKPLMSLDKGISEAVDQAAGYALSLNLPFCVVTNGWQIVTFLTRLRQGQHWRDGHCLVFYSPEDMLNDFRRLWDNLSVDGMRGQQLRRTLGVASADEPPRRRAQLIKDFGRPKHRNDFQSELQILGELVFGGRIFEDRNLFHKNCYCDPGAISQVSTAARAYLEDRYPDLFQEAANTPPLEPARSKRGPATALLNPTNIHKPVPILGDVGVGKTTFMEHLLIVDWVDRKSRLLAIRIDFGDRPSRADDVPTATLAQIESSLLSDYDLDIRSDGFLRAVYHSHLSRLRRSPAGAMRDLNPEKYLEHELDLLNQLASDTDSHMRQIFEHLLKGQRREVVLVFDNLDQRGPEVQSRGFIQAQIAASNWGVFTMVALRPATFSKSRLGRDVSGYHPRAFFVSPPRFDRMIDRRIATARAMLAGELPLPGLGVGVRLQAAEKAVYLDVIKSSFQLRRDLVQLCEDLSNGNMRLALDYIVDFMSCGHVDARKIIRNWQGRRGYAIPLHEFVKGMMYRDRERYAENESSTIINVFKCKTGDVREQLLLLGLLSAVERLGAMIEHAGYAPIAEIREEIAGASFATTQIDWIFARALTHALVEASTKEEEFDFENDPERIGEQLENIESVRLTARGSYYLRVLVRTLVYLDTVALDTPVADDAIFQQVVDVERIYDRMDRARLLLRYLTDIYTASPELGALMDWHAIAADAEADIQRAAEAVERASAR